METKLTPTVNTTNKEFSLFGSESIFKPKQLVIFIIALVSIWSGLKYIPSYVIEYSEANKNQKTYKVLTDYLYLNNSNPKTKEYIISTLNKIKNKDSIILNRYEKMMLEHQIELRKKELKEELKSLEKE